MLFEDAMEVQVSQLGELCGIDEIFEHAWSSASNPTPLEGLANEKEDDLTRYMRKW